MVNAIIGWDSSVNTVNNFLNIAAFEGNPQLTTDENNALSFANLEPGFLTTLRSTPNIDQAGTDAAATLDQKFPTVPAQLQLLLSSQVSVQSALDAINSVRCPTEGGILNAIGTLWQSAAAAAGADTPGFPLGPDVCVLEPDNTGDAYVNDNN